MKEAVLFMLIFLVCGGGFLIGIAVQWFRDNRWFR